MSKKYEIVEVNRVEVVVDVSLLSKTKDMLLNATRMAMSYDKLPADYLRLESTGRYIDALISHYGISHSELVKITVGGRYSGTWFHSLLAVDFARWLSSSFAVKLDAWTIERLEQERIWQQSRLAAKTGYLPMSEAVLSIHEDPKGYHFSNEADLLNRIALGKTAKQFKEFHQVDLVRDALSAAQLEQMAKLQMVNAGLMEIKMPFQDRKKELTQLFQREVVKYE